MAQIEFYRGGINASDCIGNGWNLVKQNYGLYFGISIVALLLISCIPCVNIFIAGPVTCGVFYCFLRAIRGEPVDFGMMFKGFDNFVPAMVVGIINVLPEILVQGLRLGVNVADLGIKSSRDPNFYQAADPDFMLAGGLTALLIVAGLVIFVVGIVIRISLFFALPLIAEHNLGALEAMKLSARAAWSNVGGLIVLFILEFLVALAGMLALCIGVFFVIPIIYAANAFAYRQVFPNLGSNFQNAPPTPDIYGGTYGNAR